MNGINKIVVHDVMRVGLSKVEPPFASMWECSGANYRQGCASVDREPCHWAAVTTLQIKPHMTLRGGGPRIWLSSAHSKDLQLSPPYIPSRSLTN
jgi:hypothetical protein